MTQTFNGITEQQILGLSATEIGQMLSLMVDRAKKESGADNDEAMTHRIDKLTECIQTACAHIDGDFDLQMQREQAKSEEAKKSFEAGDGILYSN